MEREEIMEKAMMLKKISEELKNAGEPCIRANAESVYAHARLMCIELGLDIDEG